MFVLTGQGVKEYNVVGAFIVCPLTELKVATGRNKHTLQLLTSRKGGLLKKCFLILAAKRFTFSTYIMQCIDTSLKIDFNDPVLIVVFVGVKCWSCGNRHTYSHQVPVQQVKRDNWCSDREARTTHIYEGNHTYL